MADTTSSWSSTGDGYYVKDDGTLIVEGDTERNPFKFDRMSGSDFSMRIGMSQFNVPPTGIEITDVYTNTASSFPLRARTSSKLLTGQRQKRITINLMFPSMNDTWEGPNSLRGLVAQFRACPFLPVRNTYINDVHGIDALALVSLNISTVPGHPFTVAAELVCYKFDWKSYVPWPGTFDEIFKWDDFQYYFMRSRRVLDNFIKLPQYDNNNSGAGNTDNDEVIDFNDWESINDLPGIDDAYEDALTEKFGKDREDITHRMEIYYSDREYSSMMWLNSLGAAKVTDWQKAISTIKNDWTASAEKIIELGLMKWFFGDGSADPIGDGQESIKDILTGKDYEIQNSYNAFMALASFAEYVLYHEEDKEDKEQMAASVEKKLQEILNERPNMPYETAKRIAMYSMITEASVLDKVLTNKYLSKIFRDTNTSWIHEWEIPMRRMGLTNDDLYKTVIVEGVTVTTQNAISSMPLEGKVDPTYQYLGCMGTKATVTFKVIGERAIKHMREVLERVNMSAAMNRDAGVTGFLGLRNSLINVMGMKYALVDSFTVSTIEGAPHVYAVTLSLSDFDILQQKREMPSAPERLSIAEASTVGHPIMRMHQLLLNTNAYPDLPLPRMMYQRVRVVPTEAGFEEAGAEVKYSTEATAGRYLDPDFYFKSIEYADNVITRVKSKDEFGNDIASAVPDFSKYGSMKMTSHGSDVKRDVDVKMDHKTDNPFDVLFGAEPMSKDFNVVNDIEVDPDNPNSVLNYNMSKCVYDTIDESMFDPTKQRFEGSSRDVSTYRPEANDPANTGADGMKIDKETVAAVNMIYGNQEAMNFRDMVRQDVDGTQIGMHKAFPTYMVYLIDEGGRLITYKLFDTFFGIQSLISADIMIDKEAPMDTAVLQFSNLYNKLSTPQWYDNISMPAFIQQVYTAAWTNRQRVFGLTNEMESVQIEPGMRMQIRMGYSANPEALPIVFNGTVTEVTNGAAMTVVVQGDGAELARISGNNMSPDASTASMFGTPFAEPQDLILRYMGVGSNIWKQWARRASLGMNPGDGSGGLAHFGGVLWDTDMFGGDVAFRRKVKQVADRCITRITSRTQKITQDIAEGKGNWFNTAGNLMGIFSANAPEMVNTSFQAFMKLSEDFELLKRNIYPGNGTGYRRFDNGHTARQFPIPRMMTAFMLMLTPSYMDRFSAVGAGGDTDTGPTDERTFKLNTGGKTDWEIFKACEALLPNYVLGVRIFNHRSTLFYGKQSWLCTNGVIPVFDAEGLSKDDLKVKIPDSSTFDDGEETLKKGGAYGSWMSDGSGVYIWSDYLQFAKEWFAGSGPEELRYMADLFGEPRNNEFLKKWSKFMQWVMDDNVLRQTLYLTLVQNPELCPLYSLRSPVIKGPKDSEDPEQKKRDALEQAKALLETVKRMPNEPRSIEVTAGPLCDLEGPKRWDQPMLEEVIARYTRELEGKPNTSNYAKNFAEIVEFSGNSITSPPAGAVWLAPKSGYSGEAFLKELWGVWKMAPTELEVPDDAIDPNDRRGKRKLSVYEYCKLALVDDVKGLQEYHYFSVDKEDPNSPANSVIARQFSENHKHIVDMSVAQSGDGRSAVETARDYLGTGVRPNVPTNAAGYPGQDSPVETGPPGTGKEGDAGTGIPEALGYISTLVAGSVGNMLDSSYYSESLSSIQWDALQDSAYYGLLAGTEFDTYAGHEFFVPGKGLDESKIPENILRIRKLQIACDNPFSREFAEPVLEIREPFSRFHYVTSERHIINNGIFADQTNVANQVRSIAHTTSKNNAKKEVVVKADASIPAHLIKEKVVDSGMNYEMFSWHDLENHKNMARKALKDSLQTMYGGELIVMGDPMMRPFDFLYIWDTPNKTNGWCEINRVTHHIGADTGFVTSLSVAPIVVVDDAYLFGMMTAHYALQLDRVSRELMASNLAYGQVSMDGVQATFEKESLDEIKQKTLGMTDGNMGSAKTQFIVGQMLPYSASAWKVNDGDLKAWNATDINMNRAAWRAKWFDPTNPVYINSTLSDGHAYSLLQVYLDLIVTLLPSWTTKVWDTERSEYISPTEATSDTTTKVNAESPETLWDMFYTIIDQNRSAYPFEIQLDPDIAIIATDIFNAFVEYANILQASRSYEGAAEWSKGKGTKEDRGVPATFETYTSPQTEISQELLGMLLNLLQPGVGDQWLHLGSIGDIIAAGGVAATIGAAEPDVNAGEFKSAKDVAAALGLAGFAVNPAMLVGSMATVSLGILAVDIGLHKFTTWLAEQEPISIMLLNQNGKPLQAGLKGADGIMAGQPSTLPLLSQYTGIAFPSDEVSSVWADIGYTLSEGRTLRDAETIIKQEKLMMAMKMSGRLELGFSEGLKTSAVISGVRIKSLYDGDTVYTESPIDHPWLKNATEKSTIRLKFVDAPELNPKEGDYGMDRSGAEFGAKEVRDWLANRLQANTDDLRFSYHKDVKLIINKLQPFDGYGRVMAIIVDEQSAGEDYNDNAKLESPDFDWLHKSINGELLTDPKTAKWVSPFIIVPGMSQVNSESDIGDSTGINYNVPVKDADK